MKSTEIRAIRKKFWEDKEQGHKWVQPASLIVNSADDPTTMFNTAGMQQFVPYLMGKPHPQGRRIYNIQWCVRTTDIDEVGDVSHLTMFEMMWNWSLGDYFKNESIAWSWKFLTGKEWLGLDPTKLAVSVFEWDADAPRDEESAYLWEQIGVPKERIAYLGKKNNRRGPAGATWPCGPDTEIFYWIGEGEAPKTFDPDKDDALRLEIRNNVFMAYYKNEKGEFEELKDKNVDTWMWFERLCMVVQGQKMKQEWTIKALNELSVYEIDIFKDILGSLEKYLPHAYPKAVKTDLDKVVAKSYRIVSDHLRTGIFLINEWLTPSNEGRGYVLRRILRRGYYHLMKIHLVAEDRIWTWILNKVLGELFDTLSKHYAHLSSNKKFVIETIFEEMKQFQSTLQKWEKKFEEFLWQQKWKVFAGKDAFVLYDTYGVPVELTQELVAHHGFSVDLQGFEQAMQKAQETSRAWGKKMFAKDINRADHIEWMPQTKFVGYDHLHKGWVKILKDMEIDGQRILVFDVTPFYAEGGGQTGDQGTLILDNGEVVGIKDVQKYGGVWLHFVG